MRTGTASRLSKVMAEKDCERCDVPFPGTATPPRLPNSVEAGPARPRCRAAGLSLALREPGGSAAGCARKVIVSDHAPGLRQIVADEILGDLRGIVRAEAGDDAGDGSHPPRRQGWGGIGSSVGSTGRPRD